MKKVLSGLLLISLSMSFLCGCNGMSGNVSSSYDSSQESGVYASSQAEKTSDRFVYVIQDGGVKITECLQNDDEITVPEQIEGKPVKAIGDNAFYQHKNMASITLPTSVSSIEFCAFYRCYSLKNIDISANVEYIGNGAFFRYSSLTEISVDADNPNYCDVDGVLLSKDKTVLYQYPEGKTESRYEIPDYVTSIPYESFGYHPRYLKELKIGANVVEFPDYNIFVYSDDITLIVETGSAAEEYAKNHQLNYRYE